MPVRRRIFRSGTRQTRPRLSLPDVPHLGQWRDVFADCRQTAENRRRGEHRPLPFVRMGGTCVLQKLRYTPVLPFLPNDSYFIFAGLFADNADFKLEEQIYIDAKAPYYELANDTPKLTEEEFLAQFGSE